MFVQVALVGKGLTFDSGGYNLKVQGGIETMKCDMGGAGAILGAARTIAQLQPAGVEVGLWASALQSAHPQKLRLARRVLINNFIQALQCCLNMPLRCKLQSDCFAQMQCCLDMPTTMTHMPIAICCMLCCAVLGCAAGALYQCRM